MTGRIVQAGAALGLVLAATACAPALREPPPLTALGGGAPGNAPPLTAADVDRVLDEAASLYAKRPDLPSVGLAYQRFLAAARADATRVDGLLGAMRAAGWIIEHEPNEARRSTLATEAVQAGQWCRERAPQHVECTYRLALALGQQARERRSTAKDGLDRMIALLETVVTADPQLDAAGGHRVLALVLLRAPGWPAGPGDPDAALGHARKADQLVPDSADNLLVLAEALARTDDIAGAREAYARGERLARARAAAGDPDARETADAAAKALAALK